MDQYMYTKQGIQDRRFERLSIADDVVKAIMVSILSSRIERKERKSHIVSRANNLPTFCVKTDPGVPRNNPASTIGCWMRGQMVINQANTHT